MVYRVTCDNWYSVSADRNNYHAVTTTEIKSTAANGHNDIENQIEYVSTSTNEYHKSIDRNNSSVNQVVVECESNSTANV